MKFSVGKVSVSKSLTLMCLLVFSSFLAVPPVQQALSSVTGVGTTVSAYASSPLILTIKNNLNSDIVSLAIASDMAWQLDNNATCGTFLKLVAQSSSAIECSGDLPVHATDVLSLGHISHKQNIAASSLESAVTIVPQIVSPDNKSVVIQGSAIQVPITVPKTSVSFALDNSTGHIRASTISAKTPVNEVAAHVPYSSPLLVSANSQVSGTYPLGADYYFPLMSNDSAIYWQSGQWLNYPNFEKYYPQSPVNNCSNCSPYETINNSLGFQMKVLGGDNGLWDLSGFNADPSQSSFTTGFTLSAAEIANNLTQSNPSAPYDQFNPTLNWYGGTYPYGFAPFCESGYALDCSPDLDLLINNGHPQIRINASAVYTMPEVSFFAAWAARVSCSSHTGPCTLAVYLDTGSGFSQVYTSSTGLAWMSIDGGYLYATVNAENGAGCCPSPLPAGFPYISLWSPNNPVSEGTFDMNMWYLARHYIQFPSGSGFANEAAIVDSDPTPIWITYDGQTLYSGMAASPTQEDYQRLQIQTQTEAQWTQQYFASGQLGSALGLLVENNQSSDAPVVNYTVTATSCNPSAGPINVYESSDLLFTIPQGATCSSNYKTTLSFTAGAGGLRYVSRHVTEVTGDILNEIGYGAYSTRHNSGGPTGANSAGSTYAPDYADPLLNFMNTVLTDCYDAGTCTASTYTEYYSPLFPSSVDTYGGNVADNWYYQYSTFPQQGFYKVQYYGTVNQPNDFNKTNTVYADPYVSRLSITANPLYADFAPYGSADNLWTQGVMEDGYTPTTQSLRALHLVDKYGSTDLTQAESLLNSVQWNGIGTSYLTCAYGDPSSSWHRLACFSETSYATYATGSFLGAAAVVGSVAGGLYEQWARQAAGVIDQAMWSGKGDVLGQSEPMTLWQSIGGEISAYAGFPDPVQYASNQGGLIKVGTDILSFFGYEGIQSDESPAVQVANTECTAIAAAAMLLYLEYLPGVQASPLETSGVSSSQGTLSLESHSCTGTCSFDLSNVGVAEFQVQSGGGEGTVSYTLPVTFNKSMGPSTFQGGFWVNGTLGSSSYDGSLTVALNLENSNGQSVTGYQVQIGPYLNNYKINQFVPVQGLYPDNISTGQYKMEFAMTCDGICDFGGTSGDNNYVQPQGFAILNNSAVEPFITDAIYNIPYGNWWNTYNYGPTQHYAQSLSDVVGLNMQAASGTTGTESDYGIVSQTQYSFATAPLSLTAETGSSSVSGTKACVGISPESAGGLYSLLSNPDFIIACQNGATLAIETSANRATNTYSTSISSHNVSISLELTRSGILDVQYNTGSGPTEFSSSFPISVNVTAWQSKSVYVFDYMTTTSTTTTNCSSTALALQIGAP